MCKRHRESGCPSSLAAWLWFCPNTASTLFKPSWGTTSNRPCVSSGAAFATTPWHRNSPVQAFDFLPFFFFPPLVLYYLFLPWTTTTPLCAPLGRRTPQWFPFVVWPACSAGLRLRSHTHAGSPTWRLSPRPGRGTWLFWSQPLSAPLAARLLPSSWSSSWPSSWPWRWWSLPHLSSFLLVIAVPTKLFLSLSLSLFLRLPWRLLKSVFC